MTTYSKYNFVYRLQKWMDSVPGQTFLNYAYSWGASIVILGTLFKLTHLPGANFFLFLGMGTEVFVFFISAFDRPFDKTTDGMELDTHVKTEEELEAEAAQAAATVIGGNGGTIIIGGGGNAGGFDQNLQSDQSSQTTVDTEAIAAVSSSVATVSGITGVSGISGLPTVNPELEEATANYVDELKRLTEMLSKVAEQSERLARDSEEMENLNRTLTGITKVYELQLKSASSQISTIDDINAQTRRMAEQIAELNQIYTRMIEAMTVNMKAAVVLMAMLALNVSNEVLNGFSIVEKSLNRTTQNSTLENLALYDEFAVQMKANPQKTKEWYDKSREVKKMSDSLYNLIADLKQAIVIEADGSDGDVSNIRNKEDLEAANQVMLAPGRGRGQELHDAVAAYRKQMVRTGRSICLRRCPPLLPSLYCLNCRVTCAMPRVRCFIHWFRTSM